MKHSSHLKFGILEDAISVVVFGREMYDFVKDEELFSLELRLSWITNL